MWICTAPRREDTSKVLRCYEDVIKEQRYNQGYLVTIKHDWLLIRAKTTHHKNSTPV